MGVRTVGDLTLADTTVRAAQASNWALRARGELLVARARAITDQTVRRLTGRYTWLMPSKVDVAVYLIADRDPGDGVLVALGCLVQKPDGEEVLICVSGPGAEREALADVLGLVSRTLASVDARNENGEQLIAPIFLYEPSEARDLQEALGRHLGDDFIRARLLDLIQIFPPDEVVVHEPDYKGNDAGVSPMAMVLVARNTLGLRAAL